jgi:hypothetical protein
LRPQELPETAHRNIPAGQKGAEVGETTENDTHTSITSRFPERYNAETF